MLLSYGPIREAAARSDDAFDALVSALEMDRHREEFGQLRRAEDRPTRLEGAIWRPGSGAQGLDA